MSNVGKEAEARRKAAHPCPLSTGRDLIVEIGDLP